MSEELKEELRAEINAELEKLRTLTGKARKLKLLNVRDYISDACDFLSAGRDAI